MIEIDIRDITDIKGSQLFYRNDNGSILFIDLESCAKYHENRNGINTYNGTRSVGERLYVRPIATYDLYSPDGIRLYLEIPPLNFFKRLISRIIGWRFNAKEFDIFYSVQKKLNQNGWTTLDLS